MKYVILRSFDGARWHYVATFDAREDALAFMQDSTGALLGTPARYRMVCADAALVDALLAWAAA